MGTAWPESDVRASLEEASIQYANALLDQPESLAYLASRGIELEPELEGLDNEFRLGVVHEALLPEHEPYIGWITIPYLRHVGGVVAMKFRCPPHLPHKSKYMNHPGCGHHLYGIGNVPNDAEVIAVTEGELDTVVMTMRCGIPSVAVPGVNGWRDEWVYCFEGYQRVLVFGDGDEPGRQFADHMAYAIPNARAVPMPDGHDVSSYVMEFGAEALIERSGV